MSASGAKAGPPPLEELQSVAAFEAAAERCLPAAAWEYISGGEADTMARNEAAFGDFVLRPRVLRDVSEVDLRCEMFGVQCQTPFYLSSVAKGRLVSREGEAAFARAATRAGAVHLVPHIASVPHEDIWEAALPRRRLPYQHYLLEDEEPCFEQLKNVLALGVSAVAITVDANAPRSGSFRRATGAATGVFPSPRLTWQRLSDLRALVPPDVPLYLKGVQTAEDALEAVRLGIRGLVVSNHGGRCCGNAWPSLHALEDVASALRRAGVALAVPGASPDPATVQLIFDSGVRSGLDAMKALCLGACGVGLGRPYYWAAGCHGEQGIVALLEMLSEELRHAMRQVGASSLGALRPSMLCRLAPRPQPVEDGAPPPAKL